MNVNIPYDDMMLPSQGPDNPFGDKSRLPNQNALAGHVEEQSMSDHSFRVQHLTHSILGYSVNPSIDPNASTMVGDAESAKANGFATLDALRTTKIQRKELKRKRKEKGDLEEVDGDNAYVGPWAAWAGDEPKPALEGLDVAAPGEEESESEDEPERPVHRSRKGKRGANGEERSDFHGTSMTDYQGRTYISPPIAEAPNLMADAGSQDCFIPKTCIRQWTGHNQGVSAIRLFPETGHLLLSASMDTKIKVRVFATHN